MKNKNLSFRLSIYFLIAETILMGFLIFFGYNYVSDAMFDSYRYRLQYQVQDAIGNIQHSMEEAVRFTENLEMDYVQGHIIKNPDQYLEMSFKVHSKMIACGIETSEDNGQSSQLLSNINLKWSGGILKSVKEKYDGKNSRTHEWLKQKRYSSEPEWSIPIYDSEAGSRVIIYARPYYYKKEGKSYHALSYCAIALDANLSKLNHQKALKTGLTFLLDDKNMIVFHPDSTKTGNGVNDLINYLGDIHFDINQLLKDRNSGYQFIYPRSLNYIRSVAIYWPIKSTNWFILSVIPEGIYLTELKQITIFLILLILFIGSIFAAVTIYQSIKIISPISFLAHDTTRIVEGALFDIDKNINDTKALSESETILLISQLHPASPLNDLEVLSSNLDKIKDRLSSYRKYTLQSAKDQETMSKELNLAREIEMGMVPTNFPLFPDRTDFDCFGKLIPARIVGGDLFDLFLSDENQLFITISDTLGKGIPAAMYSVITRTFIRSIANPITRLGKLMESLNDALSRVSGSDMFATVILAKLDLKSGELTYCNAGHPHPIILRNGNGEEVMNQSHGIPVGVKSNIQFTESSTILAPGESLIIYTDGITEECDALGEFFGIERLVAVSNSLRELTTQDIVVKTLDALDHFRGESEVHDDITLVAVKFLGA